MPGKKTTYGSNTGAVKAAIKKGGSMAGGSRKGPAAPSMMKGNKQGHMKGNC